MFCLPVIVPALYLQWNNGFYEIVALMFCRDVLRKPGKRQDSKKSQWYFVISSFNIILK